MARLGIALLLPLLSSCTAARSPPAPAGGGAGKALVFETLDLVAGQPGGAGWVDGPGTAAHFSEPFTFASDGVHLFLADGTTIRTIDRASADVGTLAGSYGVTGGDDGTGAAASFYQPSGMIAKDGALYLTDTENHTLRKIDVASGAVTTIAGAYGVNGDADGSGTAARFREPEGLALDDDDVLYIADTDNSTIRRMALSTGDVTTLAGSSSDADDVDAVGSDARFAKPKALALDGKGNLYVTDSDNMNVRKVVLADATVSTVATFDAPPTGLAYLDGSLFLTLDQRVVRLDLSSLGVSTLAGATNQSGFADGTGADARFSEHPAGLLPDGSGGLFVADEGNYSVRRVDVATGAVTTFAGAVSAGSDDGAGGAARFRSPQGLAIDGDTAYVADTNNHTLRKVALSTGEVTTIAGSAGDTGYADGDASGARFNQPSGVVLDTDARELYVADAGNKALRKLDVTKGVVTTLQLTAAPGRAFAGFVFPAGLAGDQSRLFVADAGSHAIFAVDRATAQVEVLAGTPGLSGATDGTGAKARFDVPQDLVADGQGNLFVADLQNYTVRKIVVATRVVTTIAGSRNLHGADDGIGQAARFGYPSAVAMGRAGDLFVTDADNDTVRRIDLTSGAVTTVIGVVKESGVRLGPLPAQLGAPSAPAVAKDGRLFFFSENSLLVAH